MEKDHFEKQLQKVGVMPAPGSYGSRIDASQLMSVTSRKSKGGSAQKGATTRYSILENPEKLNSTQTSVGFKSIQGSIPGNNNGFRNTNMEKVGKSLTSTIRTDRGNSFGCAKDRFQAPTMKK